eukprot:CAMPEP_0194187236 /NCGR_PEP_ID=MMETSP0154-20130528/49960_1 /TAXON_ID=1049557 /ORGANISM="Thalassiothrix antarctica, Strain L6-D1" /LENGTH=534 /DNA_ID=CAMNT_0038906793 /DNA_START=126 /DNA_END=1727 /DNA_ORIENTATION=+
MADCSAAGTTIDRTVSSVVGRNSESGKQLASFLGHVAIGGGGPTAMPLTAPSSISNIIPIPRNNAVRNTANGLNTIVHNNETDRAIMEQAWLGAQQRQQSSITANANYSMPPALSQQQQQHQQLMQNQYHQGMMIQQQHHQMMQQNNMMRQQMHLQNQQRQEELNRMKQPQQGNWVNEINDSIIDEDDIPQGVSIDELATAWTQAEADYDAELAANLAAAKNYGHEMTELEGSELPYVFQNPESSLNAEEITRNTTTTEDLLQIGIQEYENGNITAAVKTFETLVQLQDENNAKAWYFLGKCHAESDFDTQAIACLERSVERDPFSPETLLALGVSYVNEINHNAGLKKLKEWITHNPTYAGISTAVDDLYGSGNDDGNDRSADNRELDQVQRLLLQALEHKASPEIHEALGVVYNVSRDYDAAVASFERALQDRPDDFSLWNKLGATLANSNRSQEALPAYQEALQRRPNYVRGWLNMAISHSNLQDYHEAARCYLQTLALNPAATHCWAYLRIALSCEEQWDLLPLVDTQDL